VRRQLRELGWGALGFGAALMLFLVAAAIWGIRAEHPAERATIQRVAPQSPNQSKSAQGLAPGGDASQPASAGQPPAPAGAGDAGGIGPPKRGSDHHEGTPGRPEKPPKLSAPVPKADPPPASDGQSDGQGANSSAPIPAAPSPEASEPEPPGLLTPALTKVCAVADRLIHLC
jgi:hypothetical protein